MKQLRGYSRAFTPGRGHRRYLLDSIPIPFWAAVKDESRRSGHSIRGAILLLLDGWVNGRFVLPSPEQLERRESRRRGIGRGPGRKDQSS